MSAEASLPTPGEAGPAVAGAERRRALGELLSNLVSRELKGRYKGSVLGFLWTVLTPLFMAVIYVFFLRLLAGKGVSTESIIIGVFAWQFTVQSVQGGLTCITSNANLVKKVFFPRVVLPVSLTLANLVGFLFSLVVQFAVIGFLVAGTGTGLSAWSLALPAMILYHTLFNLALVLLLSSANVYFRDTQHLVGVALSAWFFVSPVMYDLSFVERYAAQWPWLMPLYLLNPLADIVVGYRAMILPEVVFPWNAWSVAGLLWPVALLAVAWAVFRKSQRNFADLL